MMVVFKRVLAAIVSTPEVKIVIMVTSSAAISGLVWAKYMSPPSPLRSAVVSAGVHLAVVCFALYLSIL